MANENSTVAETTTTTHEEWEYEYHSVADGESFWITEDDEWSASHKAMGSDGATGNIRSRTVTVITTAWVVKKQNMR